MFEFDDDGFYRFIEDEFNLGREMTVSLMGNIVSWGIEHFDDPYDFKTYLQHIFDELTDDEIEQFIDPSDDEYDDDEYDDE